MIRWQTCYPQFNKISVSQWILFLLLNYLSLTSMVVRSNPAHPSILDKLRAFPVTSFNVEFEVQNQTFI